MKNFLLLLFTSLTTVQENPQLVAIRITYAATATRKKELTRLKQLLTSAPDSPVITCYRGAAEMMEAKYAFNPMSKLSAFGKGKQLIEKAIAEDPDDVECRFIRYGIQRNLPAMLNYNGELKNDSTMIMQRLGAIKDQDLKMRITDVMKKD